MILNYKYWARKLSNEATYGFLRLFEPLRPDGLPPRNLNLHERQVYSQNGEDGIIETIFRHIGAKGKDCIEIGVGDGTENNTRYLIERQGWSYIHIDAGVSYPTHLPGTHIVLVTAENVEALLMRYGAKPEFDLLSIDIDQNTYWVWKAMSRFRPRVVVIEYNSSIPPDLSWAVRYEPERVWDGSSYYGASLLAFDNLGRSKGYTLVGCERRGVNAFFVRDDALSLEYRPRTVAELYRPPSWGEKKNGKWVGHHPSNEHGVAV